MSKKSWIEAILLLALALFIPSVVLAQVPSSDANAPVMPPDANTTTLNFPMKPGDWDTFGDTWGATDALGRTLPDNSRVGNPRPNKTVGIFCFMSNDCPGMALYDNTQLLAANPDKVPGPESTTHWWGKPWFGYYINSDPAVIRKHVQMLADAGVDVMIYDNTNGPTYPEVREAVCKVLTQMRADGLKTPQIAFFCGQGDWDNVYKDFYLQNKYPDLWFRWKGKPLLLVHREGKPVSNEIMNFFSVKDSWAWSSGDWFEDGHDKWSWLDNYPQKYGWDTDPKKAEETSVCVAQHPTSSIGRSFHDHQEPPIDKLDSGAGLCFEEQWKQALQIDPDFIFVTGWDEWTATCFVAQGMGEFADLPEAAGHMLYVDEYNQEFSRDIEPVNDSIQDNYYYQLIGYVRHYKGARAIRPIVPAPILMDGNFADWNNVKPEFRDDIGDPVKRDSAGWGNNHYVNQTGRNDLIIAKVSYDSKNVYFYIRTRDDITSNTDPNWMLLYIDSDNNPKTGWLGYDFVINRADVKSGSTTIQKNIGRKYRWETAATIPYHLRKNEMEIAVPRSILGIDVLPAQINFKWADNIQQTGDVSDFTLNGDAAPNDRFYYVTKLGVK
jgi:hypothetical protein